MKDGRQPKKDPIKNLLRLLEIKIKDHPTNQGLIEGVINLLNAAGVPATGACQINGTCYDNMTEDDCIAAGGVYLGNGTTCGIAFNKKVRKRISDKRRKLKASRAK